MTHKQLLAMIHYELTMQWRRRTPLLIVVGVLGALLASAVVLGPLFTLAGGYSGQSLSEVGPARMMGTWFVVQLLLTIFLPLTAAETIPLDRQLGVREILDGLPLRLETYLLGKVLSVWIAVIASLGVVAIVDGLIGRGVHGPMDLGRYLAVWAFGVLPQALFIAGLSVLTAAGQSTRKRALAIGVAIAAFCYAGPILTAQVEPNLITLFLPTVYLHQQTTLVSDLLSPEPESTIVHTSMPPTLLLGVGALQIALIALIVWRGLRRRKGEL